VLVSGGSDGDGYGEGRDGGEYQESSLLLAKSVPSAIFRVIIAPITLRLLLA
jgi:hypothetical protein